MPETSQGPGEPDCPFYGRAMVIDEGAGVAVMIGSGGNQCALVTDHHAPCYMEIEGDRPLWARCSRVCRVLIQAAAINAHAAGEAGKTRIQT